MSAVSLVSFATYLISINFLHFQQDSSLGSFEGEPVVSDESLPEIGLRAARADGAGNTSTSGGASRR